MDSNPIKDSKSFPASEVAEVLRGIEERLGQAWVEGDRSFIEQILADDWSVIDLTGRVLRKAEVLEEAFGVATESHPVRFLVQSCTSLSEVF